MDNILKEQNVVSCVSDKAEWWDGRRALDSRVEVSSVGRERYWINESALSRSRSKSRPAVLC